MVFARAGEVAGRCQRRRDDLPLRLGRKALAGPGGIGVGLEEADMADRRVGVQRTQSGKCEDAPVAVTIAVPVERGLPTLPLAGGPAVGQPKFWPPIAAVFHESEEFAVGDRPAGQSVGLQPDPMARTLAVEGEVLAALADFDETAGLFDPVPCACPAGVPRARRLIGGFQGVAGQDVLDVGQQQLLVLLFVMAAEFHQVREQGGGIVLLCHKPTHRCLDMSPIGEHVRQRRPGEQTSLRTFVPRADLLVVGVEQESVVGIERLVAVRVGLQNELLEEPGRMSQMPLGRADVGHRLDALILGTERFGQIQSPAAHCAELFHEAFTFRSL